MIDNVTLYIKAKKELDLLDFTYFGNKDLYIVMGEYLALKEFIAFNQEFIINSYFDIKYRNSLMPLLDLKNTKARIEPGAIIRNEVDISDDAIILMGAIINKGAKIGSRTMIDMNAVIGSGTKIGKNCHIGAGAVIAGIMEPKSNNPVIIEDNCFIGANAVILEGVTVKKNAIVGALSVVNKDVEENTTVVGVPAKRLNKHNPISLNEELRKWNK